MPEVSRFLGIVITMHYNDHAPPHFHARYGTEKCSVVISNAEILEGRLPPRVFGLVAEWAARHRLELRDNWERARRQQGLRSIAPLE